MSTHHQSRRDSFSVVRLHDGAQLIQNDFVLPSQYPARASSSPELALAAAVLTAAIEDLRSLRAQQAPCLRQRRYCPSYYGDCAHCRQRTALAQLEHWFADTATEADWPYTFERLCGLLGFDAGAVRARLGL